MKTVAIVPAYNEAATIADVVRPLLASPLLDEVIVVADGSTDETAMVAKQAGARVIVLPENVGKGNAMLAGVNATDASILLFVDADLHGFTFHHIESLLRPVLSGVQMMNIGMRDRGGSWLYALIRHLPLISGERAMTREVIEGIHPRFLDGFRAETALNYHCRICHWPYGTVFMPGVHIRPKWKKVGITRGVIEYMSATTQVISAMFSVRLARLIGHFPS